MYTIQCLGNVVQGADRGSCGYSILECDILHSFHSCSLLYLLTIPAPSVPLLFIHILYHMTPRSVSGPAPSSFVVLPAFHPRIARDIVATLVKLCRASFGTSTLSFNV